MKKIALFVCDIMDTITSSLEDDDLQEKYLALIKQLDRVRERVGADELLISFSTADESLNYLFKYVDEIKPYLNGTKIKLGNQYMNSGCYDENRNKLFSIDGIIKIDEIKRQIKSLQNEMDVVWVGYADDSTNQSKIADIIIECSDVPEIYGFIPSKCSKDINDLVSIAKMDGIEGLIESLDNYLNPNIVKNPVKKNVVRDIIKKHQEIERKCQATQESGVIPIESKPEESGNIFCQTGKQGEYDYLGGLVYPLSISNEFDADIAFVNEIFKRLNYDGSSFGMGMPITHEEVMQLRQMKAKYSIPKSGSNGNNYLIGYCDDYYKMYQIMDRLLLLIFKCGYLHKYTNDEKSMIKENSSMLALGLAISPSAQIKIKAHPLEYLQGFYFLCNFHQEKTPSLILYERTSSFSCLGCGHSGDIFRYLMEIENIGFPCAAATLAEAFDVGLPRKAGVRKDVIDKVRKVLASDEYQQLLSIMAEKVAAKKSLEENEKAVQKTLRPANNSSKCDHLPF